MQGVCFYDDGRTQHPSEASTKISRCHDLTSGSGIVLIEAADPTLAIRHVNPWTELCESTLTPVVDDETALEMLPKSHKK